MQPVVFGRGADAGQPAGQRRGEECAGGAEAGDDMGAVPRDPPHGRSSVAGDDSPIGGLAGLAERRTAQQRAQIVHQLFNAARAKGGDGAGPLLKQGQPGVEVMHDGGGEGVLEVAGDAGMLAALQQGRKVSLR